MKKEKILSEVQPSLSNMEKEWIDVLETVTYSFSKMTKGENCPLERE